MKLLNFTPTYINVRLLIFVNYLQSREPVGIRKETVSVPIISLPLISWVIYSVWVVHMLEFHQLDTLQNESNDKSLS